MSLTNDAVSIFRSRVLSVIQKPEDRELLPPMEIDGPMPSANNTIEQGLLDVARDSADIRRDHDSILAKAATLATLQDDLLGVFDRAYHALEQLAESRSQLARAEAVAKFEHDAREAAAQRLGSVTAAYHQTVSELEKLKPEAKRLEAALQQATDKLGRSEFDNSTLNEQLAEARAEIDRRRGEENALRRESDAARAELQSANKFVAQKLTEITALKERCELAEQSARSSSKSLEQARAEAASTNVRLDEERVHHAGAQSRIAALESQLKELNEKFAAARAEWSRNSEQHNLMAAELKDQLGHAAGLDEARQRLLTTAQNDLSGLRLQLGDLETRYAELKLVADQATAHAAHAETTREELAKEVLTAKRLQQSMLRRVKPLISALREKNGETVKLGATLADLERRFQQYQTEAADMLRQLQTKETQLVAELETERARRVVAEGALAIDRSFRPTEAQRKRMAGEG